ncbi:hypothetical protein N657DRAFT_648697 [Parathielavia appendiculata]|uniref:Uncharacterized protein n=1 Tax=Parathielavia appendiculata TaxID=2587402 RepID=A0AAN6TVD2_9PEZI|nr:hypothetical protein N657DRAFT_648697 [Parathielavia appendiculata]
MPNASQGGPSIIELDYQSLEYIEAVDDTLICPVCKTPFYSPITTPCGHTFCTGCINRALETQRTCPIDRQPINKNRDYRRLPLIIKDQLDRLKVRCPNKGCDHVCSRENLKGHYERRCEFTPVACPEPLCSRLVARRDASPTKGCLHKSVTCEHCHKLVAIAELSIHHDNDCDANEVECPDCKANVVRHRLEKHKSESCPEQQIQCRWHSGGCRVADKRRIVQVHEESGCIFEAVSRLLDQRAEDRTIINDLTSRLANLEAARGRRREDRERRERRTESTLLSTVLPNPASPTSTETPNEPMFPSALSVPHAADTFAWGSPEDYMLARFERLETQMEELRKEMRDMDAHQALTFLHHTTRIGDQIAELASKVGVLNMHTTWLMNMQRQSHAQQRAGSTAGPPSSGLSHASDSSGSRAGSSSSDIRVRHPGGSRRNSDGRGDTLTRL